MPTVNEMPPVSQADLAAIFGVTPQTIKAWERKGCPVERKGGRGKASLYRPADVIRWREDQAKLAATGDLAAMDMEEARRRKLAAEAALAEIVLDQKRGELGEVAVMAREVGDMLTALRARLMSVGAKVAPQLELATTAAERQAIVDAAQIGALDEISGSPYDFLGSSGGDGGADQGDPGEDADGGDEAAAAADAERMG